MSKRLSIFLIVEAVILLCLLVAIFREGIIFFFGIALLMSWLAGKYRSCLLHIIAAIFWITSIATLLGTSFFWLAIAFPILMFYLYYKNLKSESEKGQFFENQKVEQEQQNFHSESKNEVIDLSELHFREGGNSLAIQKVMGNTKIIVPSDVKISLDIKVKSGIVNVLNQRTEINNVNFRYFSENYDSAEKRVSIIIKVDSGNVEVVSG